MNLVYKIFGFYPSDSDKKIIEIIKNSELLEHTNIVGRGTIKVDPFKVAQTDSFKNALKEAKYIIEKGQNNGR